MTRSLSTSSSIACASAPRAQRLFAGGARALLALALALLGGLALRGERADACGWDGPLPSDLTTFDPQILDDAGASAVAYDATHAGFEEDCASCAVTAMLADWRGYLRGAVSDEDWEQVLLRATEAELDGLARGLGGKRGAAPATYAQSSLWKDEASRPRLRAALAVVKLARQVEGISLTPSWQAPAERATRARHTRMVTDAEAGVRAAKDPFLAQRYAFLLVKALFYQRRWDEVAKAHERLATSLATPSTDLAFRARYYLAGALLRTGHRGAANLELARIHAAYGPLAGATANDFRPMEESDWQDTLQRARDVRERTELWRLVGVTRDGVVAMREILKLDPRSPLLALLAVREVERAESGEDLQRMQEPTDARRRLLEAPALEELCARVAGTPGADRPWLHLLVAGHLAAKRGDLELARARLTAALTARPDDARVKRQARASLALALVLDRRATRPTAARGAEIAAAMRDVDEAFGRRDKLRQDVRGALAASYVAAGGAVEGELLSPGLLERQAATAGKWRDPSFLRLMIARARRAATPFDRFLLDGSYTVPQLEQELALALLNQGAFAESARVFRAGVASSTKLGTDPFAMRLLDCHDCDHQTYENAPWTHASVAARLAELELVARGKGPRAAGAALLLGNALYNLSWFGNARVLLRDTHQTQDSPRAAERWYKRAYEVAKDRELRAKAAFFAAKAELGDLLAADGSPHEYREVSTLPFPARWFSALQGLSDTKYYQEVLSECTNFRAWIARKAP
ncbi:MAG: hypothetical protein R3B48_25585 [Kofleriaceae bacterium]